MVITLFFGKICNFTEVILLKLIKIFLHNIERVREGHKTVTLNTTRPTQINHTIFLFPVMHSVLQNENHLPSIINDPYCYFVLFSFLFLLALTLYLKVFWNSTIHTSPFLIYHQI